jgi:outer membrane protein assembly factor BamD
MITFACKFLEMKRNILILSAITILLSSCASEFNAVYKSQDYDYKYEYAKESFATGHFTRAITLLQELVTIEKGTDNAQECLYMLGMAEYCSHDYVTSSEYFKKYVSSYPKGIYAEQASYYNAEALYRSTPEARLDQTGTYSAITAYQDFLDVFPDSKYRKLAQSRMFELQDKLIEKEYLTAKLYYNLGSYFGNCNNGGSNYEASIITAQNAVKDYPYTKKREQFILLIMKGKFGLAQQSIEEKKLERFRDAEDECYGFLNEFPDSKDKALAEKYIAECKKITKD